MELIADLEHAYKKALGNDTIKKLSGLVKVELKDYTNTYTLVVTPNTTWKNIRSNVVTENGVTLWQLYDRVVQYNISAMVASNPDLDRDRIVWGEPYASKSFVEWVLNQSEGV
jgi:hypothetical protein